MRQFKVNNAAFQSAKKAGEFLKETFNLPKNEPIFAVIPGTGWTDSFPVDSFIKKIDFTEIPGLEDVAKIETSGKHGKWIGHLLVEGKHLLICSRIHGFQDLFKKLARLSIEMLFYAGVKFLISTSGCGSLTERLSVGDIAAPSGFLGSALYGPPSFAFAGDGFGSAEEGVDKGLHAVALSEGAIEAAHMITHGPVIEGRKLEKKLYAKWGAEVIGMSGQWEMYIASLYKEWGAKGLMLCLVTNDDKEVHDDDEIARRGKDKSAELRGFLERLLTNI